MIDSYEFGRIVIDGRTYTSDVIVLLDRVKDGWWRKEGHKLQVEDIEDAMKEKPDVLVVGTGHSGLVDIPKETADYIKSKGIELIAEKTVKATEIYNRLSKSKRVIAALHLTC
ncbi:MAG: hypothetical protein AVW06_01135 [Hadesarchaea archaeon DG-33-1]|nr:MAG: hypothetical protein AVW06_01135 [Hadesarchaea archaeon DG-33-1]